jgi:superfamily II DNA helicase RecQ
MYDGKNLEQMERRCCRPLYSILGMGICSNLGGVTPITALTATASDSTISRIKNDLCVRDAIVLKAGMYRRNLVLRVQRRTAVTERYQLRDLLTVAQPLCVVFCNKKATCEEMCKSMSCMMPNATVEVLHGVMDSRLSEEMLGRCRRKELQLASAVLCFGIGYGC